MIGTDKCLSAREWSEKNAEVSKRRELLQTQKTKFRIAKQFKWAFVKNQREKLLQQQ